MRRDGKPECDRSHGFFCKGTGGCGGGAEVASDMGEAERFAGHETGSASVDIWWADMKVEVCKSSSKLPFDNNLITKQKFF